MEKAYHFILLLFISLLLVSCSTKTVKSDKDSDQISYDFSQDNQTFQIIPLYEEVLDYTNFIKKSPSMNNKQEYNKKVVIPFQNKASKENVDIQSGYFDYFSPTNDTKKLAEDTKKLLQQQKQINAIIKRALIKSSEQFPGTDKTIFIMPNNPESNIAIQEMQGVAGWTLSQNVILLQISPSYSEESLKYLIAHEYHHTKFLESASNLNISLIEKFIFEGKADNFASIIYPEHTTPWTKPLSEVDLNHVLGQLHVNKGSLDPSLYNEFFDGNAMKNIPKWSNYKVGFQMTKSYLEKHPHLSIEEWTKLNAEQIVQGSKYHNIYK
ncbi:DUF2268 domain-containing protein [Fictibacillus phosphorivorans]|uniref:DUF2268 domain-containing protein n=1 Tax=Fictibacillus phosphorivorans TaxID=1221500 RepID=UPI001885722C|nr:DUF2268 domain-containing putative Zn-dependent protease [Fictibacillus phosphorivorans]